MESYDKGGGFLGWIVNGMLMPLAPYAGMGCGAYFIVAIFAVIAFINDPVNGAQVAGLIMLVPISIAFMAVAVVSPFMLAGCILFGKFENLDFKISLLFTIFDVIAFVVFVLYKLSTGA